MVDSALPIHLRKRLSLRIRDRDDGYVSKLREELIQIWNIEPPMERRDARRLVSTKEWKVRVASMKVDDIEVIGGLYYLRKLKNLVCLRINDCRIETKRALGASDKPTFCLGVTTREQRDLVTAPDELIRKVGVDSFGSDVSDRRYRLCKR